MRLLALRRVVREFMPMGKRFWSLGRGEFFSDLGMLGAKADERGGSFVTLYPGQEFVVDKLLPAKDLKHLNAGEAYTVYSRPDREKKKPSKARYKWGTREELAESAYWMGEAEDDWTQLDVSHIVRDRDWEQELVVIVGNSVRFQVV
jgi:hypothetical protein